MNNSLKLENRHTGEILWLRRFRLESGEEALQLKGSLPPGQEGPPLHYHVFETEEGTIIKGKLGAQVNGRTLTVEPGQKAVFPAGALHNWWNAGDELLEFEGTSSPAVDLDRYLQAVFAVLNAGKPDRPDLFYFAHVAHR
ncbi:MAG: cupin domain-containing protein, partial [Anaerolineae bacterium]